MAKEMIRLKQKIFICSLILILFGTVSCNNVDSRQLKTQIVQDKHTQQSIEELYQDSFVTMLFPHIRKAVEDYYGKPHGIATNQAEVLSVERPHGNSTFAFRIKIKILPYTVTHNVVGEDHITFYVDLGPEVKVEKFEHIKDYGY